MARESRYDGVSLGGATLQAADADVGTTAGSGQGEGVSLRDALPAGLWRPDRLFVSQVVAGVVLLGVLSVLSWPLALIGLVYVMLASLFFSFAYRHAPLARDREALVWLSPWLVAVALWLWVFRNVEDGDSSRPLSVFGAVLVATVCYLGWQLLALAVRQLLRSP